jgi:VIT1/CCC1 family predicted Fe2+/Mn2+ transporter
VKTVFYIFMGAVFILVTFFGLGPVLLADGSLNERILTLVVVILIYLLLGWITLGYVKKNRQK